MLEKHKKNKLSIAILFMPKTIKINLQNTHYWVYFLGVLCINITIKTRYENENYYLLIATR